MKTHLCNFFLLIFFFSLNSLSAQVAPLTEVSNGKKDPTAIIKPMVQPVGAPEIVLIQSIPALLLDSAAVLMEPKKYNPQTMDSKPE